MAKVEDQQLHWPEPAAVVRDNGDAVVELRQNGDLVGEINFSKIVGQWLGALGIGVNNRHLKSV
jgi:hypothetical protein